MLTGYCANTCSKLITQITKNRSKFAKKKDFQATLLSSLQTLGMYLGNDI